MILAVVDDLLFRSKISTAAKGVGVELVVASTLEDALARARERQPAAILIDLDGKRVRPIDLLRALAADPALKAVPTTAFVSHVHTPLIATAREEGVGRVLARGAFAQTLPELLRQLDGASPSSGETA